MKPMPYNWPAFSSKRRDHEHLTIGFKLGILVEFGDPAVQAAFYGLFLARRCSRGFPWSHVILPVVMFPDHREIQAQQQAH
jgi:hypothetical protein